MKPAFTFFAVMMVAVGLTFVFWGPLWTGGGFVGGDVYSYYLPQKVFFVDRLQDGEFPLWNNRVGHGYPLVGESQTGTFYPFHVLLYGALDANTAYHLNHLGHYVLAFLFTWMYARRFGLSITAALLAAIVYTYGWFPMRSCLEWAIIGGAYLPLALWCAESFLQTRLWRYSVLMSVVLGVQMLAGHYNLAFITQLTLLGYVPLRLGFAPDDLPTETLRHWTRCLLVVAAAAAMGFLLAAVQLVPTWELKVRSQRGAAVDEFNPGYGHIPPLYWSQIVAPWWWYTPEVDIDRALQNMDVLTINAGTNKVEAHLYFGLIPLLLAAGGLGTSLCGVRSLSRRDWLWAALGGAAFLYTAGWFVPIAKHLPGFGYFMGPGRYGIVTTLAVGLTAGNVLDRIVTATKRRIRLVRCCVALLMIVTVADLWLVGRELWGAPPRLWLQSRRVGYVEMVDRPPIRYRDRSPVRRIVEEFPSPVRVYAPGPNLATLTGAASTPSYLGLGPMEYYDPNLTMPTAEQSDANRSLDTSPEFTAEQIDWLQRAGVTHILSFEPLSLRKLPIAPTWQGFDPMLNRAWARYREPIYLYRLQNTRGRAAFVEPRPGDIATVTTYLANRAVIETECGAGGRLVLADLMYPGWQVQVDGQPAEAILFEGMYRAVDVPAGYHTVVWTYQPQSVYWGAAVSVAAVLLLAIVAHVRFWHPQRFGFLDEERHP